MDALIIGKGLRVKNTLMLPIKDSFDKVYLYSRNKEESKKFCKDNELYFLDNLNSIKSSIRVIFVAIPPGFYNEILKKISLDNIKTIFLDTPIIGPIKNLRLLKYPNVKIKVTEDWISKPFFLEIKKFLEKNKYERVNKINFHNSGFSYHALAASKSLFNINKFHFIFCIKKGNNFYIRINNLKINIFNPRNYLDCYTTIETKKYILIDNQYSNKIGIFKNKDKKNIFFYRKKNSNDNNHQYFLDEKIINNIEISKNYENEDKLYSIKKKINNEEIDYLLIDGLYDSLIISSTQKFGFFFDFGKGKYTIQKTLIKCLKYLI